MDISSIAASASAIKQSTIQNEARTAVAAKVLDSAKEQGEAMVELINQVAAMQDGQGIDVRA